MSSKINGEHLFVYEEDGVLTIALADKAEQPTTYFLLQRSLSPSDQDRRLGQDGIYVELNEQSHSAYGGIKEIEIRDDKLLLTLDDQTAVQIGAQSKLEVRIDLKNVVELCQQLNRLLAGQGVELRGELKELGSN